MSSLKSMLPTASRCSGNVYSDTVPTSIICSWESDNVTVFEVLASVVLAAPPFLGLSTLPACALTWLKALSASPSPRITIPALIARQARNVCHLLHIKGCRLPIAIPPARFARYTPYRDCRVRVSGAPSAFTDIGAKFGNRTTVSFPSCRTRYLHAESFANAWSLQPALLAICVVLGVHGGEAQRLISDRDIPFEWWQLFQSPALNALVAQAFKANPTVTAAQAALAQAQELVRAQRGFYYPSVGAGFQASASK
jgi:hypothetical protein